MHPQMTRRTFLTRCGSCLAAPAVLRAAGALAANPDTRAGGAPVDHGPASAPSTQPLRYKIAASDWMLLKRQKLGGIKLAKACGLDGIETDMGSLGTRADWQDAFRDPAYRQQYLKAAQAADIQICSLAVSAFYGQSWADHPRCDQFTDEWIATMQEMGIRTGFLPLGVKGDIAHDPRERAAVISHLKRAAPIAAKAGAILGVEAALDTDGYKRFLDDVGSPAVRLYYNFGDQLAAGYDIYQQVRDLGAQRICQIHCTEKGDGARLGQGKLDMPRMKRVLDDIGWSGWLVLQRSRVGKNVQENFTANAAYCKSIFQPA